MIRAWLRLRAAVKALVSTAAWNLADDLAGLSLRLDRIIRVVDVVGNRFENSALADSEAAEGWE